MDNYSRLSDYGRRVLGPQTNLYPSSPGPSSKSTVYPFWSPAPVQTSMTRNLSLPAMPKATSELKSQVKDLERQVAARVSGRRNQMLMTQMNFLMSAMEAKKPDPDARYMRMMETMQEQQRTMSEMVRTMRDAGRQGPVIVYPQAPNRDKPDPLETQYRSIKADPLEYKRLLGELDFEDNKDEDFLGINERIPFDASASVPEKAKLMQRLKANQDAERQEKMRRRIKGIRRFRVIGFTVLFPIFLYGQTLVRKRDGKVDMTKSMNEAINVYLEVAKAWVVKAIRAPLTSVLNDPNLDLNVVTKPLILKQGQGRPDQMDAKILKIQVRIKGIIDGLREFTTKDLMPVSLRIFLEKLTGNRAFLPSKYLLGYEKSRLDFDSFGAVRNQTRDRQQMMICMFFVTRVIVGMLMLHGDRNGLPFNPNSSTSL